MTAPDLYRDWTPPPDRCPVCCGEPVMVDPFDGRAIYRLRCASCRCVWEDWRLWWRLRDKWDRENRIHLRCIIAPLTPPASTAPPEDRT